MFLRSVLVLLLALGTVHGQNGTDCPAGFKGASCAVCYTDQGCVDSTGNAQATCSNDVNFQPNSQLQSYSCNLPDGGLLSGLVVPGSLLVQCHTGLSSNQTLAEGSNATSPAPEGNSTAPASGRRLLQDAATGGNNGSFCSVGFKVASPAATVQCNATQCTMGANSPFAQCQVASCSCPGGCGDPLIDGLMGSVKGPISMECAAGGACSLKLSGLPIESIDAQCDVGECLVPTDQELGNTTVTSTTVLNTNPIIAAIPSMLLALIIVFLGSYTLANRHLWKYTITAADAAQLESLTKEAAHAEPRLGALEFKNLTLSAPVASPKQLQDRLAALRAKALQRTTSASPDGTDLPHPASLLAQARQMAAAGGKGAAGADVEANQNGASALADADAAAAADYVANLHTGGTDSQWIILKDLSFTARSGEVVGVIGPSGCGKTSLLGSVAGSALDVGGSVMQTGHVLVDGKRRKKRDVAYVPQSDVLIPSLTVEESVRYSALLRLPEDTKPLDMQFRVERVLEELGLQHVARSQVGGSGRIRGVSGGERRRVTIGMELVTDPAILILDEPTSGLDSYTAINLMRTLRHVAARGRVVMASLHQPSRDMFLSMDQVILMSHGRMLYAGRPGDAEAWFARRGLPCPEGTAIAEHMLKVASDAGDIKHLVELQEQHKAALEAAAAATFGAAPAAALPAAGFGPGHALREDSVKAYSVASEKGLTATEEEDHAESFSFASPQPADQKRRPGAGAVEVLLAPLGQQLGASAVHAEPAKHAQQPQQQAGEKGGHSRSPSITDSELSVAPGEVGTAAAATHKRSRKPGAARQMAVLFWRSYVDIIRNPTLLRLHVVIAIAMGLLTGFVFWNLELNNVGIQNRMGGTFFALAFFGFASLTTVDLLMNERAVVTREVRGGYYNPVLYLTSKLTLDGVLLRMIPAVLYWAPFYYMAGFKTASAYAATYVFCLIAFSGAVGAMSMSVTILTDTPGQASFTMNFLLLFSLIFTGFLVNVNSIPAAIRWLHYASIYYYAFEAMVSSEVSGLTVNFQAAGFGEISGVTGETFLKTLGFDPNNTRRNIWVLIGMYGGFALLAMALFVLRLPRTRHGGHKGKRLARMRQRLCGWVPSWGFWRRATPKAAGGL